MKEFVFLLLIVVYASNCGGNCLSRDCSECPCGNIPKKINIEEVCGRHNWDQRCCKCIVEKSSNGNANAVNITEKHIEVGVFLIDKMFWKYCNNGSPPCSVEANLNCAKKIYIWGNRWHAWNAAKQCNCY